MCNNKPPLAHSQDIREKPEFWQKDYRPWTPDAALYALKRFNEGLGVRKMTEIRHVREAVKNHPAYTGNGTIDGKLPPNLMVTFQDRIATLDNQVREKEETLRLYQERFGILKRDNWGPDEDLNAGDSVSELEWKAEQKDIRDGQMNTSNYQQMGGANGDRPFYVFGEHNRPADIKPSNPNPGSHQNPRIKQESIFGGCNRLANSAHLGSTHNQSQPELLLKQESIFGSPSRSITQRPNATLHSNTSTSCNFNPAVSKQPPKVLPEEESIFGGYDRFAGNAYSGSQQPHQSQPRSPIKQESMFDDVNGCILQQLDVLLVVVTTTFGDFQHHFPLSALTQPLQEESMLCVNELPDSYRQPRMSNSGAPHQPERALYNMIKTEEEEEPSHPSTSIPRPPKPIVSVAGNLLGDPSSPKVLKDRAKREAICEKAKGPLPPTIQPKTLPNGKKAGVFIDQEEKFRTTGVYQYFDPGCFNCGSNDHEGSVCKKGCYRCGKDHPLPHCPYIQCVS
ncbi:hypothetical protein EAF00_000878 [Botryotinia globosa]|nr:hypothetical protein EAF00_000878 [Botryotinia globosa]